MSTKLVVPPGVPRAKIVSRVYFVLARTEYFIYYGYPCGVFARATY